MGKIKDDPFTHKMSARLYFKLNKNKDLFFACTAHKNCKSTYTSWKKYHPEKRKSLQRRVDNLHVATFESLKTTIIVNGKEVNTDGTVRHYKCTGIADRNHTLYPYCCRNCRKEKRYLETKIRNRQKCRHLPGQRYAKPGINYKNLYLYNSEF